MTGKDAFISFDHFTPGLVRKGNGPLGFWFVYRENNLLISRDASPLMIPFANEIPSLGLRPEKAHFLGTANGHPCLAAEVSSDASSPEGWRFVPLRPLFSGLTDSFFVVAARAFEIVEWDRTHRFCGRCGTPTRTKEEERARECPSCGLSSYPRISPAAIVAVTRGDTILLARAPRFPPGMYSVLAGFVEPGETLEDCVRREVLEETGIEVKSIRYFASQPWPFPNSLMVAFTAEHAGGEIVIDKAELVDAGWFTAGTLPTIPDKITVARKFIDWFLDGREGDAP
jgi:NAD+ diphosphatase